MIVLHLPERVSQWTLNHLLWFAVKLDVWLTPLCRWLVYYGNIIQSARYVLLPHIGKMWRSIQPSRWCNEISRIKRSGNGLPLSEVLEPLTLRFAVPHSSYEVTLANSACFMVLFSGLARDLCVAIRKQKISLYSRNKWRIPNIITSCVHFSDWKHGERAKQFSKTSQSFF